MQRRFGLIHREATLTIRYEDLEIIKNCVCRFGLTLAIAGVLFANVSHGHDVEVITTTDVTSEGMRQVPASKAHPVYYVGLSGGYKDFAAAMNGDKLPSEKDMIRTLMVILARNGFLLADKKHPPTQFLTWNWGTMYSNDMHFVGSTQSPNTVTIPGHGQVTTTNSISQDNMPAQELNYDQKLQFLGGEKLGLMGDLGSSRIAEPRVEPPSTREDDAAEIGRAAHDNLYVIVISAFDFDSIKKRKPVLLWKTRIGCPCRGLVMDRTLPVMVAISGPNIGHETPTPALARSSDQRIGKVKVGDPTLQEFMDTGPTTDDSAKKDDKH